jgi:hypothetical protein
MISYAPIEIKQIITMIKRKTNGTHVSLQSERIPCLTARKSEVVRSQAFDYILNQFATDMGFYLAKFIHSCS